MRFLTKNRNLIIAILLAVVLAIAGVLAFVFTRPINETYAADNYGEFKADGYYDDGGVVFYAIKVKEVGAPAIVNGKTNYYPTYTLAEDKLQFIKYGETVILNEGESILISFARQEDVEDDNKSLEEKLVGNRTNGYLSDYVDFLTVSLKFNEKTPETDTTVGEIQSPDGVVKKMFGYVFSPYSENIVSGSKTKEEGLVQFTANYEHGTMMNEFNFSFYVFKKETYQRNEDTSYNGRVRPNTTVDVLTGGGNYVTDPATRDKFYGEYFYYYKNQNLPTLTYNPERYEVNISKTIHSTLTTYTFAYNKTQGEVVYSKNQNPSTEDVYARDIAYKKNADGTITLRFKDIGIYDISYTAIYYKNNARVELRTLNEEFNLQDRLTIFGAQATYNDHSTKQTELRNEDNSISADITGNANVSWDGSKITIGSGFIIASTNQPQVKFLMNSLISSAISDTTFKVYYSNSPDLTNFSEDDDLTLTSNFTRAGYYYVIVKHAYENLKTWYGSTAITSNNKVQEQQFLFEIKDQTPTINILKMDEEEKYTSNKVMSGYYTKGVYTGSYHNGGIFIEKFAENSEFDLPTTYEIQKRAFGTDNWVVFTPELKSNVEGTGDAKDGYIVGESGHYKLVVRFGNASSTTRYFDVDKEQIGGLNAYKVVPNAGNKVFTIVENSQMNNSKIWAINQSFILNWQNKASGAKISASYVRFAMENSTFAADANDYIIGSMIATDSLIRIADNPETAYSKPQSLQLITANEVLNLAGLYIFKLQDEAGNVAYFAIIYDNSTAVVLQGEENGDLTTYEIIKGFNNISSPTRVFFGTGKLVKLEGTLSKDKVAQEYYDQIFGTLASLNNDRFVSFGEGENKTTFAKFEITSVEAESVVGVKPVNKPITNLSTGYDIIEIEIDENGVIEKAYTYRITDESSNKKVHNVQINTDKTGLGVHFGNVDNHLLSSGITSTIKGSEGTDDVLSQRTTYFDATNEDILYLTWTTLTPNIDAYVDLNQGGIKIHYYEMIYNPQLKTYEYAQSPTNTIVITEDMVEYVNGRVCIKINVVDKQTLAGKYEIVRQYIKKEGISLPLNDIVGNDYVIRKSVFYVDRNPIIKAPSGTQDSPQIGAHASIKFFDGVDGEIPFDQLFRQAQNSGNAVIQTNKLPVGIYIPIAKYGYIDENKEFKDNLKLFGSQIDQTKTDPDAYYAPFELTVILQSPVVNGYYVNYIYSHDENGYFKLAGWVKIAAGDVNETAVAWGTYDGRSASLLKNELEGTTAWSEGVYSLKIGTMRASDRETTLQNFYFNFEVVGDEPEFDLTAQYPTLPNMEDKEILLGEDGKYYTNAEQIKVSWNDLQSTYMVKIDKSTIQYSINGGTWQNIVQSNIISNGTQNYFTIGVNDVNNLKIKMSFEVYGEGINAGLFPGGNHTAIKEIVFDRQAPTTIINSLMDADIVKHNLVGQSLLREIGLRYNISASEGIYKYFTFATTDGLASKFEELFSSNQVADTNRVYIRMFSEILEGENTPQKDNKYGSKIIEIGCPLNPNSSPSNLFNEQSALTNEDLKWTRYVKGETIQFTPGQYYEIVELDLAGNMTIYSVYICEKEYSLTVEHTKDKDEGRATIITNDDGEITIESRERFAINNILFNSGAYKYVRLNINGTEYLITPFVDPGKAYNLSTGEEVELSSVVLTSRENVYDVKIYNAVAHANANDKGVNTIKVSVASNDARLNTKIKREEDKIGVLIFGTENDAVQFNGNMTIYALNKDTGALETFDYADNKISLDKTSTYAYYYITRGDANWSNYLFLIVWYDNFGTKYSELVLYNQNSEPDYTYVSADPLGVTDLTNEMQSQMSILVSTDIQINISNLYTVKVERRDNDDILFREVKLGDDFVRVRDGYTSYKLTGFSNPETDIDPAYLGGVVVYRITATANIEGFGDVGASVDIEDKVYTVTIYNQFPAITLRNANGENITQDLFNKKITHSEEVYITYLSGNKISESYGFNSKVYLRLRGSEESYVQIPSGYVVSKPGSYDIRIENYNENGVLAKTWNKEFVIANYDVAFYSVVKYDPTNLENPYQVIVPTGELYKRDNHDYLINYHYILNSDSYEISVNNGVEAKLLDTIDEGPYTTKIYQISSVGEGGTSSVKFNRQIAITVIPSTNSILGSSFAYFMGTDSEAVEIKTITTAVKDVYLFEGDLSTSMTLQWNSYYGIPENVIFYQISRDGGTTWSDKIVSSKESLTRINFNKSGNYVIMFTDLAGNTQTISSSAGVRDRYRINFIKSVIFLVNGETPIDNAVYNGEVEINIPTYTLSYYSQTPSIVATLNGEEFYPSKNENGNYSFTKAGTYVVYFNAAKGGNKLGISKLTFTIINENDSRWAFNYVNYNNYNIEFIKYNNNLINANNIINGNEILMSVVLGNESFDNGIYTIKMTTNELPKQSFEFSFWLNNAKPDIQVSEQEGVSTTNDITVSLNTINLFEMVGDCTVKINGRELVVLNKEYFEVENFETNISETLTETSPYYIQVYTDNGKLIYSYKVEIVDPLNAITIILIVVGCVAVAVGVLLFFLLRKKLRIK